MFRHQPQVNLTAPVKLPHANAHDVCDPCNFIVANCSIYLIGFYIQLHIRAEYGVKYSHLDKTARTLAPVQVHVRKNYLGFTIVMPYVLDIRTSCHGYRWQIFVE